MHILPRDIWKKKFKLLLLLILFVFLSFSSLRGDDGFGLNIFAGENKPSVKFMATLWSKSDIDLKKDSPYEFWSEWYNKLLLSFSGNIKGGFSFKASVLEKFKYLHSEKEDYYKNSFDPYEIYFSKDFSKWTITIGNQIISWGISDLSPLDVVNPSEMEEFTFEEEEFLKIPLLMVKVDYYPSEKTTIEGIYTPFYQMSHMVLIDSDWSILPRDSYYKIAEEYKKEYGIDIQEGGVEPYVTDFPPDSPFNGEVGALLKSYGEGFDYQAGGYYGWDKTPFPEFNNDLIEYLKSTSNPMEAINNLSPLEQISFFPLMTIKPEKTFVGGGGISTSWKGVGIRSEAAIRTNASIYSTHLELLREPLLTWNFGADYDFPWNIYGNLIIIWAHFFVDQPTYLFKKDNLFSVLLLRGSYFHDTLTLQSRIIYVLTQYQLLMTLRADYQYSDNLTLFSSVNIIDAEEDSLLYQFRKNDFFSIGIRYSF